ncbi:RluA family pseudouridine synthase [Pseudooceanicola sp. LIPI14-2-Ac024]|uniref:RluA family pseudouridine synthase n=1 Tax=Pseudooceanicola sp. LIPI14-2-Ac024 TaxID=3344875 RepID=UPI0035CEED1E
MSDTLSFRIAADPPGRLDKALARDVPEAAALSRTRLARLIADGAIRVGGTVAADPKAKVAEGDLVEITLEEAAEVAVTAEAIPLDIRYEDDDLIVLMKPAGMVVHPAPGSPSGTLVNALLAHCGDTLAGIGGEKRPGIVHRIDKETSGLLVIAKSDMAHHGLSAQFADHSVERAYNAICHGVPDAAEPRLRGLRGVSFEPGGVMRIATEIGRHRTDRQKQAVMWSGGRRAVTRARVVEPFGGTAALLECRLETGRTHQIRVHMAYTGHGLIGDPVYGAGRKVRTAEIGQVAAEALQRFPRQALHAAVLGFVHPRTGETLRFEAEMPGDMAGLLALLRGSDPQRT